MRQVTDRPQGSVGCAIAPDGNDVCWFDDQDGDELGRWQRQPFGGGEESLLLADLAPAYAKGIVTRRGGGAVVGRDVDDGFELAVASASGLGGVVYRSPEHARLLDADDDVAAISHPPASDLFHPIVRVVDLSDGRIVAELDDQGLGVTPIAFSPARDRRLLVAHSRHDRKGLLIWSRLRRRAGELPRFHRIRAGVARRVGRSARRHRDGGHRAGAHIVGSRRDHRIPQTWGWPAPRGAAI